MGNARSKVTSAVRDQDSRLGAIAQVGRDRYRLRVRRRALLDWFSRLGDVIVTEDGRVIFPGWMLPAVRSLFTVRRGRLRERGVQLALWEE